MIRVNLRDFPTTRRFTYLNSASISLMPRPAVKKLIEFDESVAGGGTIGFDEKAETDALEGARKEAARLLEAHDDEIAILSSATDGICSLAFSLDVRSGANVVSTDAGFPSVVYPWMRLAHEKYLEVRLARNRDGLVSESGLESLVDDNTAVISISHVEYGTGQRYDLRWLSELAHSHGALLLVDATQSAGLVPIDVHRDKIDALVAGGYKGLLGPFGAAVFYLKRELVDRLTPRFVGWRSTPVPYDLDSTEMVFADGAKKFEYSTMSYASAACLAESMRYIRKIGRQKITEHVLSLTGNMIRSVKNSARLSEAVVLTPEDEKSHSSIANFRFHGVDQSDVATDLSKRKVIVSQRFNGVRFSFHLYNTAQDIAKAIRTLEGLLEK